MKWPKLLSLLGGRTIFHASALLAGGDPPHEVSRQLSRWSASGRLLRLRREVYAVAAPFATSEPDRFAAAGVIRKPSYISLQSALAYHGVIPEAVPGVTSVTTGRPGRFDTPIGVFQYRHIHRDLFWGYRRIDVGEGEAAFVATPEKSLLDLFHLTPGAHRSGFIEEVRLEPGTLDTGILKTQAEKTGRPKLIRAAALVARLLESEAMAGEVL